MWGKIEYMAKKANLSKDRGAKLQV
jgi:hypothetical protein